MKTVNECIIAAPAENIYHLAAATDTWPRIFPHYRFVHSSLTTDGAKIVHMGARRRWIPVSWVAVQYDDPATPEIRFVHVRGWTRGMDVVWRFLPHVLGTRVVIEHELQFRFPFAAGWIGENIVGKYFVHYIAGRTLATIKQLAERPA